MELTETKRHDKPRQSLYIQKFSRMKTQGRVSQLGHSEYGAAIFGSSDLEESTVQFFF